MTVKYHINPSKGPLICSADSPERCHYGIDAPHFSSKEEAEERFQEDLSKKYGTLPTKKLNNYKSVEKNKQLKDFENKTVEELINFANTSAVNHKQINKLILQRTNKTLQRSEALSRAESRNLIDSETLSSHKRDFNDYRNRTAELVEAFSESRFYNPHCSKWTGEKIGHANRVESFPALSRKWYESRFNSVGGSDVGTIAVADFSNNPASYIESNYNRILKTKITPITDSDYQDELDKKRDANGALYRGTVWESRIRDDYAKSHPELVVYSVDDQYSHPEREWQKINVDGLISDREDGIPNGILEVKTGSNSEIWQNGVPDEYRAQTLYYLNTTGLEYADVRALVNDSEVFEYRLYKNDEVIPGSKKNMEQYIQEKIEPWFKEIKQMRK